MNFSPNQFAVVLYYPDFLTPKHRQMSYLNALSLLATIVLSSTIKARKWLFLSGWFDPQKLQVMMINKQWFCNAVRSIVFGSSALLQKTCSANQKRPLQNTLMRLATGSRKFTRKTYSQPHYYRYRLLLVYFYQNLSLLFNSNFLGESLWTGKHCGDLQGIQVQYNWFSAVYLC